MHFHSADLQDGHTFSASLSRCASIQPVFAWRMEVTRRC